MLKNLRSACLFFMGEGRVGGGVSGVGWERTVKMARGGRGGGSWAPNACGQLDIGHNVIGCTATPSGTTTT